MEYIKEKVLSNDEKIIIQPEKSKVVLFWKWFFGVLFFWVLLIPLIRAISFNIKFSGTEYAVTDKKVVEKYGSVSVHCDEMLLNKIENVTINQTFWGRIFHYGNVHIQGANRNNVNFIGVKNPDAVKKAITDQL